MRDLLKTMTAVGVALGTLLGAKEAMAAKGVVFVHGTGDQTETSARDSYWTSAVAQKMAGGYAYKIVGYQGASCAGFDKCAWGSIADQVASWASANAITDIVVVTHSNGSNPVRYMLGHGSAITPAGRYVSTVNSKIRKVVFLAGDNSGTVLADKVTTPGTLASVLDPILGFFGSSYNNPAVWQQRQDRMGTYNSNGTFAGSAGATTVAGKPAEAVRGTSVYAAVWSGDAYCGGYGSTTGLKAALVYGWGYYGCADGFLGCASQGYVGSIAVSDARLNHNQSRRDCRGVPSLVAGRVNRMFVNGYDTPADTLVDPAAQACNATIGYATNNLRWLGCSSAMRTDTATDFDCVVAYGADNGHSGAPAPVTLSESTSTVTTSESCAATGQVDEDGNAIVDCTTTPGATVTTTETYVAHPDTTPSAGFVNSAYGDAAKYGNRRRGLLGLVAR